MSHAKHERSLSADSASQDRPKKKEKEKETNPQSPPQTPPRRMVQIVALSDSEDDTDIPVELAPKPPTRPKSGRPAHDKRGERTEKSGPAKLSGLVVPSSPHTPPRKSKKESRKQDPDPELEYSPFTKRLLGFTTGLPIHLQASPVQQATESGKGGKSGKARAGLNTLQHRKDKGWMSAGHATTFEAYKHFEQWKNDYSPHHYSLVDSVDIVHAGNPFDRPKDIRARPVMFCWNTPDHRPPTVLKGKRVPVFRAKYKCTGHCRHGHSSAHAAESEDEPDSDSDSDSGSESDDDDNFDDLADQAYVEIEDGDLSSDEEERDAASDTNIDPSTNNVASLNKQLNSGARKKTKTKGLTRYKCKVVLHAEVYSDNLGEIHFYQRHTHPEAHEKYLDTSHYIRQCMLEMASLFNLPPSSIKRRECFCLAVRKDRVLADPLLSIGVFHEHNPDKIFCYHPPNYNTDPPSEFAAGIHHPYGTQVMILNSQKNGVGHDTTYRNMNENRAPLTIMITVDENSRMVPGFAYLSADIKIPAQVEFLRETKRLVEKMAADLVNGRVPVAAGLEDKRDELLAQARLIVQYGWIPAFFMIDKSRASKAAIEEVFPGVPIRICQFHVMQAILRWQRDNAPEGERQPRPVLSLPRKHMLLQAVREVQRCHHISRWSRYTARFRRRLDIIVEGSQTSAETLWDYFEANWFCEEWRNYWTDMGLPDGSNRDGMLSTNNWTERAFKTFNQVFLGNRTNKSAYRLVLILANEWFQYYQAWEPENRVNQEALEMQAEAYRVWSSTNAIKETTRRDGRRAWIVARLPREVRNQ
ncbi:hypothetical protein MVEN_00582400 [Mycena venus]|uniref:MULE transposase domain-containing protein n=1 Tax=Mycena venus TaxID=2733690 RepID=A0A8H6YNQ3_9AGAR|nr:hypothetical protein MVEN_00582400 [Mycena venus]